ncbi:MULTISPECIES: BREX-1 system adenine-specific DNA-methyltransferase PglX [Acinetobacter]|uniref:site-specific DNA-methyltransferase (adenine-specific) n=1 Tax=Acinetobacter junii TaxID=40215 RepID=A0A365PFM8_ACIJU|nr:MULTISPECIES: BREX-1 system adenine-specific DNA-methyltransferase PglX [Acinetobacter]RBA30429.1 BREX-1 system adenine-specific DNA-methyltransferase PglX [Acinetobacter junii]RBA38714.1 BREX-1 system adenine-specific DNA-methyltransferase PglX [Acinetobacter junii]RBA43716.1 BREX-1 system adenine-specific DNA-methyltransferase PglX [Acinetobacter junii]WLF74112.1 BREX-1 system adenine-specific DNA-methyltransferase PglX [Acinetobacter junii]
MNTSNIKKYAPQARNDFIAAMRKQAAKYGITADSILPAEQKGDLLLIGDQVFPLSVMKPREKLIKRIQTSSFEQTVDYIAYSWFNRLCAIRYMECKGLLDHGRRVLSSADGSAGLPQILEECLDIDLPGLDASRVAELKLDGNKDEELYRELLLAQCQALNQVMPLLFEQVSDESELLLPDNLTKTDSLIRDLVSSIPEEDWSDVQIIGWLYQFYISEKKDQVIGKVVKSEDIPAATQLFTPNWIVKYLVQNSVGRLWMMAQPESTLASSWEYYIQPAEQTDEVNAQLKQLIDVRISEDGDTLNPESITVLDPACGSGHILVEAYDCLKAIYLERGYRSRDIPRLILENNLYGIDIDTRAAQLASFALLMKAREDDRRLFSNPPNINIIALQDSQDLDADQIWQDLNLNQAWQKGSHVDLFGNDQNDLSTPKNDARYALIQELVEKFKEAKTFGSLICMDSPEQDFADLQKTLQDLVTEGDTLQKAAAKKLLPLLIQAKLLVKKYDAVIANPPYMGGKGMNTALKDFAKKQFPDSKSDLFAMFIERGFSWCKDSGFNSMVTMQSWMFLSSYEAMREKLLHDRTLSCMVHMGNGVMGIAFGTAATVMLNNHVNNYEGSFSYCENDDVNEFGIPKQFPVQNERLKTAKPDDFKKIPGSPVAYWVSDKVRNSFSTFPNMGSLAVSSNGVQTGNNNNYVRSWNEINITKLNLKWFPYNKGGSYRKWYGNYEFLVDWEFNGRRIKSESNSCTRGEEYYLKLGITWSDVTSGKLAGRLLPEGFLFDAAGPSAFYEDKKLTYIGLGLLNTKFADYWSKILNPTLHFQSGDFRKLTLGPNYISINTENIVKSLISIAKFDWDSYETSWDFTQNPIIRTQQPNLKEAFNTWQQQNADAVAEMKRLEEENNKLFIDAYGLQDELTPDVPDEQITLTRADREKDSQRLVSYALGCMMGRYSLDEPGLIYAHAGNQDFDASRYQTFPADADGIIPLTEMHWFEDDATHRIREFLTAVWGKETLDANMQWLAESLDKKASETAEDTIRRYLASKFYKDHMQTYKKRPIYWLFSSGKQGAFQALVYLHRYNESTLARMRTEYVMPLISKMAAYANSLETAKESSDSTAEIQRIEKKLQDLHKQQAELSSFEEKLRHYADQRITLDLDDGVKVNYGKFGDLLAEVKAVTGEK